MTAAVVEFAAILTAPDAVRLRTAYGLSLDHYIPEVGYLERLAPQAIAQIRDDFLVRACTPLDAARKLSPAIADLSPPPDGSVEFTATLFEDGMVDNVATLLGTVGASDVRIIDDRSSGGAVRARFNLGNLALLSTIADIDDVVWIEPVLAISADNADAAETIQSGVMGRSPIWDQQLHGEGQVIGVIDRGNLAIDHCFFADAAPNKPGPAHRKVLAIYNETGSAVADHPTYVCSAAVGDDRGSSGTHQFRGGAWNAKVVYSNNADLFPPKSRSLLFLLKRAHAAGALIHSSSWRNVMPPAGGSAALRVSLYNDVARDADAFSWANEDDLVVASGANTGGTNSPPGTAKNTLCVAAAKAFPDDMSRASGVDGPTRDGRRKPEIMAVGENLDVASSGTTCGFGTDSGTSMATPHVAAAAALVRQYFLEGFYPSGKRPVGMAGLPARARVTGLVPTGALVKAVLLNSTVDMTGEQGYPSDAEGWGILRLDRALYFDGGPRRLAVKDVRRNVGLDTGFALTSTDRMRTYSLFVNDDTEQLKITLVWTDPPASPAGYNKPWRNFLKLTATPTSAPGLASYLGNDIDAATGLSRPGASGPVDQLNNVQMIIVDRPQIGPWTVTVSTNSVYVDQSPFRQGFALVASGGLDLLGFLTPP